MLEALRGARRQRILYKNDESLKLTTTNIHAPNSKIYYGRELVRFWLLGVDGAFFST